MTKAPEPRKAGAADAEDSPPRAGATSAGEWDWPDSNWRLGVPNPEGWTKLPHSPDAPRCGATPVALYERCRGERGEDETRGCRSVSHLLRRFM